MTQPSSAAPRARRGFLNKLMALALGAVALAVPAGVALLSALNPLRQKTQGGRFFRVTSLAALPEDGTPRRFAIVADRRDAWTLHRDQPIGLVFLRRTPSGQVQALAAECPHAGCTIGYDDAAKAYLCPCHTAHFDLDGRRTDANSPSPRDMDELADVDIRGGDEVWVKFERFRLGISERTAKA